MGAKFIVLALVLGIVGGLFVVGAPPAAAAVSTSLDPPMFHSILYVPGETIRFTVTVGAGDPTTFDIVFAWNNGVSRIEYSMNEFDDVVIPPPATSITRTYTIPSTVPDGDFYWLEVHDASWIENGGAGQTFGNVPRLFIRTWQMTLESDRSAYLPGDTVTILWSVNLIRDGSLAPAGFGKLWVWDSAGVPLITPNPMQFSDPTGSHRVTLLGTIPQDRSIVAFAYYNSTATAADRVALGSVISDINGLRMLVNVPRTVYEPGGVVTVDVSAKVSDLPGAPFQPGAPGVVVDIIVTDQVTGTVVPTYGAQDLVTDAQGNLRHAFQLSGTIADGTTYLVRASGVANNAVMDSATDSLSVVSASALSVILRFNKGEYISADTIDGTVEVVTDLPGPFVFVYEIRDVRSGSLLFRQTTDQMSFSYTIPDTFAGPLRVRATADDGQGNRATSVRDFGVASGILVISLDRAEYNEGETVTASFALRSNVISAPTFFYEVFDTSGSPVLVKYGIASVTTPTSGAVAYLVPANPALSYEFRITASEGGRAVVGSAEASYVSGVLLQLAVDRAAYLPGETIRITYALVPRGRTALPQTFSFLVGVIGAPGKLVQTTSSSGEITYQLPSQLSSGELVLFVFEQGTGASMTQVVKIGPSNPLWDTTIGGIPAFAVLLGVGMLFIILLFVLLWRRSGAPLLRAPKRMEPPAPAPMTATPGLAPMMVNCKSCGSPIEITTSKRPIEVMCPNCGETQIAT